MDHVNWLKMGFPSIQIDDSVSIEAWKPNTVINYNIQTFEETGYSYIYRPSTAKNKRFYASAVDTQFFGMESDELPCRVFNKNAYKISIILFADEMDKIFDNRVA